MITVSFEGLCAFQEDANGTRVLTPDFHKHRSAMVANSAAVNLPESSWYPDLMFQLPDMPEAHGSAYYVWLLERTTVTLGTGTGKPKWASAEEMKSVIDLRTKHSQPTFNGNGQATKVELRGGSLNPDMGSRRCFGWFKNGQQVGDSQPYAEVMEWKGAAASGAAGPVITSDQGIIVLKDPEARLRITNTRPEPDAMSHHFHGYYHMLRLNEEPLELRYSTGCLGVLIPREGNCTPTAIIP